MFSGREMLLPTAVSEEELCRLGRDRAEGEGRKDKAKLSKPRELFILCFFSWFSISPHTWDGHLKLPSWDGASKLLGC